MKKFVSILMVGLLLMLILTGCSSAKTVTVTSPPVTVTVTKTSPPVTETITQTSPKVTATITTTATVTATVTPTWIPSIYRGSMNCTWSGTIITGAPINGTLSVTIDENGDFKGPFEGTYTGTIAGQIDLIGHLIAFGTLSDGTTHFGTTWSANITLSGKSLSTQGKWTSDEASGTFSGTGKVSY